MFCIPAIDQTYDLSKRHVSNLVAKDLDLASEDFLMIADEVGFEVDFDTLCHGVSSNTPHLAILECRQSTLSQGVDRVKFTRRCTPDHRQITSLLKEDMGIVGGASQLYLSLVELGLLKIDDTDLTQADLASQVVETIANIDGLIKSHLGILPALHNQSALYMNLNRNYGGNICVDIDATDEFCPDLSPISKITDESVQDVMFKVIALLCHFGEVTTIEDVSGYIEMHVEELNGYLEEFAEAHEIPNLNLLVETCLDTDSALLSNLAEEYFSGDPNEAIAYLKHYRYTSNTRSRLPNDFWRDIPSTAKSLHDQIQMHIESNPEWGEGYANKLLAAALGCVDMADHYKSYKDHLVQHYDETTPLREASFCKTTDSCEWSESIICRGHYGYDAPISESFEIGNELQSRAAISNMISIIQARQLIMEIKKNDDGK